MKAAKQKGIALHFAKAVSAVAFSVVMGLPFLVGAYYTKIPPLGNIPQPAKLPPNQACRFQK